MIASHAHVNDLIGAALGAGGEAHRDKSDFSPDFWNLRTGLLGELAQKLANYRLTLTLTGDFNREIAASRAFRDYVRELLRAGGPIRFDPRPDLTPPLDGDLP